MSSIPPFSIYSLLPRNLPIPGFDSTGLTNPTDPAAKTLTFADIDAEYNTFIYDINNLMAQTDYMLRGIGTGVSVTTDAGGGIASVSAQPSSRPGTISGGDTAANDYPLEGNTLSSYITTTGSTDTTNTANSATANTNLGANTSLTGTNTASANTRIDPAVVSQLNTIKQTLNALPPELRNLLLAQLFQQSGINPNIFNFGVGQAGGGLDQNQVLGRLFQLQAPAEGVQISGFNSELSAANALALSLNRGVQFNPADLLKAGQAGLEQQAVLAEPGTSIQFARSLNGFIPMAPHYQMMLATAGASNQTAQWIVDQLQQSPGFSIVDRRGSQGGTAGMGLSMGMGQEEQPSSQNGETPFQQQPRKQPFSMTA